MVNPSKLKRKTIPALIWLGLCLTFAAHQVGAQQPSRSRESLAVDEVKLDSGKRFYGIVTESDSNSGVVMLVRRTWLKESHPEFYAKHVAAEIKEETEAYTQHLFRLESWWKSRRDDFQLVRFADQEMERYENLRAERIDKGENDLKPFTLLRFQPNEIREVFIQPPANRHLAGVAWKHGLERVSSRNAKSLRRELEASNLQIEQERFDLSSQLGGMRRQSDEEWNARLAILEYQLRKELNFQGVGSRLIRIDPNRGLNQPADLASLIPLLAGGDLTGGGQLDELLNELGLGNPKKGKPTEATAWWAKAAKKAEADGFRGFVVTRLIQDISRPAVEVEISLIARTAPDVWQPVYQVRSIANLADVKPASIDRIRQDPQVDRVLKLTKGLGLGSDAVVDAALRQGAATEIAMQDAKEKLAKWLARFRDSTDNPVLKF